GPGPAGPVAVRDRLRRPHRSARHGTGPGPGVQTGGRIRPFPTRGNHASHGFRAPTRGAPMRLTTPTARPHPHHSPRQLPPPPDASDAADAWRARLALRRRRLLVGAVVVTGLSTAVLLATAASAHADPTGAVLPEGVRVVALADSVTTVLNNVRNWIM